MKRTIRRTIGALCMVSAITVAAIPVPDIEAYNPNEAAGQVQAYSDLGVTTAASAANLTKSSAGYSSLPRTGKTYTLNQQGNITYLDWQFEYAAQGNPDSAIYTNAFITGFNNMRAAGGVDLSSSLLFSDYVYINLDAFDGLTDTSVTYGSCESYPDSGYAANKNITVPLHLGGDTVNVEVEKLGIKYTLDGDPSTWSQSNPVLKFFNDYFIDDLNYYKDQYTAYKQALADGEEVTPPPTITRSLLENDNFNEPAEQQAYLCDKLFGNGATFGLSLHPTVRVKYKDDGSSDGTEDIYVFKSTLAPESSVAASDNHGHILYVDSQSFLVMKFIQLIGIGEDALYGVNNITDITLGGNIQYICDRAFSDSSVLSKIIFGGNAKVGNQSFKGCSKLRTVSLDGVQSIGKEAFANTIVDSIVIPESLTNVDDGAFYSCKQLGSVSFEGSGTTPTTIGTGAFCDLENLSSVDFGNRNISQVGDYSFALTDPALIGKDKLADFKYPDYVTDGDKLGKFALANRQALKNVTLSSGLRTKNAYTIKTGVGTPDVPDTLVAGCSNLEMFKFPVTTKDVTFDPTMFYDVVNPDFYVYGPEKSSSGFYANPRQCTWRAGKDVANNQPKGLPVTYMYYKDDNESNPATYEISDGFLIQGIDATGKLVNCTYVPDINEDKKGVDLVIPDAVAGITINAIDSNCFDPDVKANVTGIKIDDGNGIATIENDVFKDFDKITFVDLGNGVRTIGDTSFSDCNELRKVTLGENIETIGAGAFKNNPKLTEIHFDTPADIENPLLELGDIGTDAFSTGSPKLTVFGEIGSKYGPFLWSMQTDNYVDANEGVRVCYKTNSPSNMTVILDNTNSLPTLVDYPHYDQLDKYAKAAGLDNGDDTYSLINKIKAGSPLNNKEQELLNAVRNIVVPSGIKSIDVKGYLTREASSSGYNNSKNIEVYLDPLKAKDADEKPAGLDYFSEYKKYGLFNGYYEGGEKKNYELTEPDQYFLSRIGENVTLPHTITNAEYERDEKNPIGNDIVEQIILNDVEYLPDLAFYNCENLELLSLGSKLTDIGDLPIADCTKLSSLACGSGKYEAVNGILYENLTDGSKRIVECFPGQGDVVGYNDVSVTNHPDLANVSDLADGAFANCDEIYFADLTGMQETTIPPYCFYDCDKLKNVTIPENMDNIQANAFGEDPNISLDIKNPDLTPDRDTFGDFVDGENPYIYTTKGSIVERLSKAYGEHKLPAIIRYSDEYYTVIFRCNLDGKELYREKVKDGEAPLGPDADDQKAHETSFADKHDGYEFAYWADEDGNEITNLRRVAITKNNTIFLGIYKPKGTVTPDVSGDVTPTPSGSVTPNPSGSKSTTPTPTKSGGGGGSSKTKYPLTVVYGSGSGSYPEGTKVIIEAIDAPAGKVFDKWVVTGAAATVYSSTSKATTVTTAAGETIITATYKDASSSGGSSGGSGGTSGTKTSTGTHNRVGADGSPIAGTGSSTRVDITKPGISDVDKAYASVSGSTDSFVVKITESADAANAVATALANKYGDMTPIKYFAMDISLYDATGTNKITDTTGLKVNVTIPIPDALRQYAGNNKVGAVVNGTQLEDLACKFTTVDGIPCVSFTATHFSPYTIYVDTNNLQVGYMDSSPKTGDPIHPKWFITIALAATSLFLFLKRDKVTIPAKA